MSLPLNVLPSPQTCTSSSFFAHPVNRRAGIEAARERDADFFADGQRLKDGRHGNQILHARGIKPARAGTDNGGIMTSSATPTLAHAADSWTVTNLPSLLA